MINYQFGDYVQLSERVAAKRPPGAHVGIFIGRQRKYPDMVVVAFPDTATPAIYNEDAILPAPRAGKCRNFSRCGRLTTNTSESAWCENCR